MWSSCHLRSWPINYWKKWNLHGFLDQLVLERLEDILSVFVNFSNVTVWALVRLESKKNTFLCVTFPEKIQKAAGMKQTWYETFETILHQSTIKPLWSCCHLRSRPSNIEKERNLHGFKDQMSLWGVFLK